MKNLFSIFLFMLAVVTMQGNSEVNEHSETNETEYYRIDNLSNPRFTKLDKKKAKFFFEYLKYNIYKNKQEAKEQIIFPKYFDITDLGVEAFALKLEVDSYNKLGFIQSYKKTVLMNPEENQYYPTTAGKIYDFLYEVPHDELRGGNRDGFVIIKAKNLNVANPPKALTDWVKYNLDGIFGDSSPKLKLSISSNNQLSLCVGMGKIHTYDEKNGKLKKVRTLDTDGDLVAFARGKRDEYSIVTVTKRKADQAKMHSFKGKNDRITPKNIKLWDKYRQDLFHKRPYPTLDYANGEYLFQYYLHMWEAHRNSNLHSGSFRLKIKDDGSVTPRTWQTSHTFGMDALHNGTDWVSIYSTDKDYFTSHPGIFIDKFDKNQKALLFSSPQRWAEPGQGSASDGAIKFFYTGLGGVAYDGNGYGAVFNNPKIKTAPMDLPQNVGFVYLKGDYESTPRRKNRAPVDPTGNLENNARPDDVIVHTGIMNSDPVSYKRKVTWLSDYTSIEDGFAKNTDIVAIGDRFIVVWEKWAKVGESGKDALGEISPIWDFIGTEAVVIDKKGNILKRKSLGKHLLNDWDDLKVRNGKALWASYDNNFTIEINTLDINLNHNKVTHSIAEGGKLNINTIPNTTRPQVTTGTTKNIEIKGMWVNTNGDLVVSYVAKKTLEYEDIKMNLKNGKRSRNLPKFYEYKNTLKFEWGFQVGDDIAFSVDGLELSYTVDELTDNPLSTTTNPTTTNPTTTNPTTTGTTKNVTVHGISVDKNGCLVISYTAKEGVFIQVDNFNVKKLKHGRSSMPSWWMSKQSNTHRICYNLQKGDEIELTIYDKKKEKDKGLKFHYVVDKLTDNPTTTNPTTTNPTTTNPTTTNPTTTNPTTTNPTTGTTKNIQVNNLSVDKNGCLVISYTAKKTVFIKIKNGVRIKNPPASLRYDPSMQSNVNTKKICYNLQKGDEIKFTIDGELEFHYVVDKLTDNPTTTNPTTTNPTTTNPTTTNPTTTNPTTTNPTTGTTKNIQVNNLSVDKNGCLVISYTAKKTVFIKIKNGVRIKNPPASLRYDPSMQSNVNTKKICYNLQKGDEINFTIDGELKFHYVVN